MYENLNCVFYYFLIISCEDGSLYILSDGKNVQDRKYSHASGALKNSKTGKEPSITAIYHEEAMNVLLTGNKDGSVVCWSTKNLNNEPSAADGLIALFRFELSSASSSGSKEDSFHSSGSASQVFLPDLIAKQIQSLCFRPLRINGKNSYNLLDLLYSILASLA